MRRALSSEADIILHILLKTLSHTSERAMIQRIKKEEVCEGVWL